MRVTSEFFIQALIRRVFGAGGFAAVARRGATEAGAIFITARDRRGKATLYGPAPQAGYDEKRPAMRRFIALMETADLADVDARISRETRFDSDLWLVEVEPEGQEIAELIEIMTP